MGNPQRVFLNLYHFLYSSIPLPRPVFDLRMFLFSLFPIANVFAAHKPLSNSINSLLPSTHQLLIVSPIFLPVSNGLKFN